MIHRHRPAEPNAVELLALIESEGWTVENYTDTRNPKIVGCMIMSTNQHGYWVAGCGHGANDCEAQAMARRQQIRLHPERKVDR